MQEVSKKRIGILRGGAGDHYHASIKKGGDMIMHIAENLSNKYKIVDILIDQDGVWHINGLPVSNPHEVTNKVDIVWNHSHPSFGNMLKNLLVPHISEDAFSHALENSKEMLKAHMEKLDVFMPRSLVLPVYQEDFDGPREKYAIKKAKEIHAKLGAAWSVKSFTPDSTMGIHLAKTFPELIRSIEDGVNHNKSILVEEFISGKVAALHSVPSFRNQKIYIFPFGNTFGSFNEEEKNKLHDLVKKIHNYIGNVNYLKSDFVINNRGRVYVLGITTTPNLKSDSHFAEVCGILNLKPHDVVDHIIQSYL